MEIEKEPIFSPLQRFLIGVGYDKSLSLTVVERMMKDIEAFSKDRKERRHPWLTRVQAALKGPLTGRQIRLSIVSFIVFQVILTTLFDWQRLYFINLGLFAFLAFSFIGFTALSFQYRRLCSATPWTEEVFRPTDEQMISHKDICVVWGCIAALREKSPFEIVELQHAETDIYFVVVRDKKNPCEFYVLSHHSRFINKVLPVL